MAWDTKVSDDDIIASGNHNEMIDIVSDISGSHYGHSSNADLHFPSSNLTGWLDNVYAPTGLSSDVSSQLTIGAGLTSTVNVYHDGTVGTLSIANDAVTQGMLKSGSQYWNAYQSGQIALYEGDIDTWDVNISGLSSPTVDNLHKYLTNVQSAGRISGGIVSDNGNGTINTTAGFGLIRTTNYNRGELVSFDWSVSSNMVLTDNSINWVYVNYNSGSPVVNSTDTAGVVNGNTSFNIAKIYREGNTLHILNEGAGRNLYDLYAKSHKRASKLREYERASGVVPSQSGSTRTINITAGKIWRGLNELSLNQFWGGSNFTAYRISGAGGGYSGATLTEIDNTNYNNTTTGGLTALATNQYGIHWLYMDVDDNVYTIYGSDSYKLAEAEAAVSPSTLPDIIDNFAMLIGKATIKKNASTLTDVVTSYETFFPVIQASIHNNLGGLDTDDYQHLTSAEHGNIGNWDNAYASAQIALYSETYSSEGDLTGVLDDNYYPSGVGNTLSTSYTNHSSNTSNPHEVVWTDVSTAAKTDLADDYAPSSGYNTHINDSTIHFTKATIDDDYYPSSLGNSLNTSYINHSSNTNNPHEVVWSDVSTAAKTDLNDDYAPSSGYHTHITNTANPHSVVWSDVSTAAKTDLNDDYYPSSVGNTLNTSYTNHSGQSNKHIDHSGVDITAGDGLTGGGDITTTRTLTVGNGIGITINASDVEVTNYNQIVGNSNSGQTANAWLDTSGSKYNQAYLHSSSTSNPHSVTKSQVGLADVMNSGGSYFDTTYYPSGVGNSLNTSYINHSSNTSNPHEVVWSDVSTAAKTDLADDYAPSSGYHSHITNISNPHSVVWSNVSTAAITDLNDNYYPSSLGNSLNISYVAHSSNTNNPHEVVWSDVSTAAKTDLADDYAPSSGYNTHINDSTIHYAKSTLDDDYYPSSIGAGLSGSFQSHATDATIHFTKESIDDDYYPSSIGAGLSGSYNTHIGTNNAHHDLVTLSGTPNYITLSNQVLTRAKLDLNDDTNFSEGTGINLTTNTVSVLGYTLISANSVSGQSAKSWLDVSGSNYNTAYAHSQDNSQAHSDYLINNGTNTNISGTTISGGTIKGNVPMTYSLTNIRMSAQQNINVARFKCPVGKKAYVYQAYACNSSQTSVDDLLIQILSGNTNVYKTSSATLQQGNPLATSNGGNTEIRFMYSGAGVTGIEFGSCMIQVGVY